jgi:hypothetical protein
MLEQCHACRDYEINRAKWGPGPWQDEPSRAEWRHAGLPCIAHRGGGGAWCGYVGVPPGHPAHGKEYDDVEVDVHGGLTYAQACAGCVCHVARPGESDALHWFGFDCCHAHDAAPAGFDAETRKSVAALGSITGSETALGTGYHYWTLAEVQSETNRLAEQLAAMK